MHLAAIHVDARETPLRSLGGRLPATLTAYDQPMPLKDHLMETWKFMHLNQHQLQPS